MDWASRADVVARGLVELRWSEAGSLALEPAREAAVAEVWARAVARPGSTLHDSPILVFRGLEQREGICVVQGEYVPYRYYFARRELGDLGVPLDPIGVNGMTLVSEAGTRWLVLGRRSPTVTWYPGGWECVPSGALDHRCARADGSVDFAGMVLAEFEEELCLPAARARAGPAFVFVYDRATGTYDVCCTVEAACTRAELSDAVRRSMEYSDLTFIAADDPASAGARLGDGLIPTAAAMIDLFGELKLKIPHGSGGPE